MNYWSNIPTSFSIFSFISNIKTLTCVEKWITLNCEKARMHSHLLWTTLVIPLETHWRYNEYIHFFARKLIWKLSKIVNCCISMSIHCLTWLLHYIILFLLSWKCFISTMYVLYIWINSLFGNYLISFFSIVPKNEDHDSICLLMQVDFHKNSL